MYQKEVIVKSATGLHARPGSDLVELAMPFSADITLEVNGKKVNAKEVLEVLMANINCGDKVLVTALGKDEEDAGETIAHYIETTED